MCKVEGFVVMVLFDASLSDHRKSSSYLPEGLDETGKTARYVYIHTMPILQPVIHITEETRLSLSFLFFSTCSTRLGLVSVPSRSGVHCGTTN